MPYTIQVAANRAGVDEKSATRYVSLGLVGTEGTGDFSDADIRRMQVYQALEIAGLPIDGVSELVRAGNFSLEFIESAGQYVFVPLSDMTFGEVSDTTGIPIETLSALRESMGGIPPDPNARIGEEELEILHLLQFQHSLGFRPDTIEQGLRVYGESLRRMAETEAEWFRSEIMMPMLERGLGEDDVGRFAAEIGPRLSELSDQAVLAIYHRQQRHAWLVNIISGIAMALDKAGLHHKEHTTPAMCFLDITGYTRLTLERGDRAAADLAERMRRLVERPATTGGGRAVKWLGDGVMFYFPTAASAVEAAIAMVFAVDEAGMPPAHVGIHAGPLVFREGDYYGQTVNIAARIGEFARPGEVLVSKSVVDLVDLETVGFAEIGPVELKGVGDALQLYLAAPESRTSHA